MSEGVSTLLGCVCCVCGGTGQQATGLMRGLVKVGQRWQTADSSNDGKPRIHTPRDLQ